MLFQILLEMLLLPAYVFAGFLGFLFPLNGVEGDNSKIIVFVHGWLTQNPLYLLLKKFLEKEGFTVYMTNFGLQTDDFYISAQKLQQFIKEKNLNDVYLVGVSGGAIISYLYLQKYSGWQSVKKFIGVGGPFKGTPMAYLALPSKAGRQMLPNSNLVQQIESEKVLFPEKVQLITAKHDELVPASSSQLDGVSTQVIVAVGHVYFQAFSKKMYDALKKALIY